MTLKDKSKLLKGRKIVRVEWNRFASGRTNRPWTTDPRFILDDGTSVRFVVEETEVGEYGIDVCVYPKNTP